MHKILLPIFLILSASLYGQTITNDWFFQAGDSFSATQAASPESEIAPKGGVDIVWDYSSLFGTQEGMNNYVDPSEMSQDSLYPDATVATGIPGVVEIFYNGLDDTLGITGIYLNILGETWIDYEGRGELLAIAPMMYGDTVLNNINATVTDGNVIQNINVSQRLSFEGIGTVITPNDTILTAAYIKTEVFDQDGIMTAIVHLLMKDGFSNPVIQFNEQLDQATGELLPTITWATTVEGSTSTTEVDRLDFKVTSDPLGQVFINSEATVSANIQLINMNGQVVNSTQQDLYAGDNLIDFTDINNSGQYTVFILDKESGQFYTHQIAIVK